MKIPIRAAQNKQRDRKFDMPGVGEQQYWPLNLAFVPEEIIYKAYLADRPERLCMRWLRSRCPYHSTCLWWRPACSPSSSFPCSSDVWEGREMLACPRSRRRLCNRDLKCNKNYTLSSLSRQPLTGHSLFGQNIFPVIWTKLCFVRLTGTFFIYKFFAFSSVPFEIFIFFEICDS
jgi:hypothetical protein